MWWSRRVRPLCVYAFVLTCVVDQDILHHLTAFGVGTDAKDAVKLWDHFRAVYLSDVSSHNPLLRLTPSDKLTEALELLSSGVHHIIIVDEGDRRKVVNILSQFDLLKFLDENSDLIPLKKLLHPVGSMDIGTHAAAGFKLHAVLPNVTTRDAFVKVCSFSGVFAFMWHSLCTYRCASSKRVRCPSCPATTN